MNTANRTWLSLSVIVVTLIIALICSLSFLANAAEDVDRAVADTISAGNSARRIESKRPTDLQNNTAEMLAAQLPRKLDDAMKAAEIDPENLDRISPQPPRGIGQGDYSETPAQLVFHQITLRQTLQFITALTHDNRWLTVRDVHLSRPSAAEPNASNTAWNIELTISYLSIVPPVSSASAN